MKSIVKHLLEESSLEISDVNDQIWGIRKPILVTYIDREPANSLAIRRMTVSGAGRSISWQIYAKKIEHRVSEEFHLRSVSVKLNKAIHPYCVSNETCFMQVSFPLNFEKLNRRELRQDNPKLIERVFGLLR